MRGIVYDGEKTTVVDGLELRKLGPREVIVESSPPACATATCRS